MPFWNGTVLFSCTASESLAFALSDLSKHRIAASTWPGWHGNGRSAAFLTEEENNTVGLRKGRPRFPHGSKEKFNWRPVTPIRQAPENNALTKAAESTQLGGCRSVQRAAAGLSVYRQRSVRVI